MRLRHLLISLACAPLAALPPAASAEYPEKPVKMIVAWPAGGGTDNVARIVAKHLSARVGQQVLVENRGGASGMVGTEYVAKAPADGYTIQYTVADSHSINPHVFPNVRYDAVRDFVPIAVTGSMPTALVVNPNVPARSIGEFIQLAKKNPGKLSYSSWGIGSGGQIRMEAFKSFSAIELLHVPYQGSGPGFTAVLGGQVDSMMVPLGMAQSHHRAGKVRILAVDTPNAPADLKDVSTFAEQGVPLVFSFWQGVLAPAGTPGKVVNHLNREINALMADAAVRADLARVGMAPGSGPGYGGTPQEVKKFLDSEHERWGKVIRNAKISSQQ